MNTRTYKNNNKGEKESGLYLDIYKDDERKKEERKGRKRTGVAENMIMCDNIGHNRDLSKSTERIYFNLDISRSNKVCIR